MRNRIFSIIGILWGGGIVVSAFFREMPVGDGAFEEGRVVGHVTAITLGAVMLVAGVYYIVKGEK